MYRRRARIYADDTYIIATLDFRGIIECRAMRGVVVLFEQ
jgi:hypothetical protein